MRHFVLPSFCVIAILYPAPGRALGQDERSILVRVSASGKPVAGAKVWLHATAKTAKEPAALTADARGEVDLQVSTNERWWFGSVFARDPGGRIGHAGVRLLQPGANGEVEIALHEIEKRTGRVVDAQGKPVAGAKVVVTGYALFKGIEESERKPRSLALPEWERQRHTVHTDKDGRFELPGEPEGYGLWLNVHANSVGESRFLTHDADPAEVTLTPLGSIVLRFSGPKLKGVSWRIEPKLKERPGRVERLRFHFGELDGQGDFTIRNVVPGKYSVKVWHDPKVPGLPPALDDVVVAATDKTVVPVAFTPAARVTGRVVDRAGKGVAGAPVGLGVQQSSEASARGIGVVVTDANGAYTAYGPPGWLSVFVDGPPSGYIAPLARLSPALVAAGKSHAFPDIILTPSVAFAGTVVFDDGKPAARAIVDPSLMGMAARVGPVPTDAEGRFTLKDLRPDDVIEPRVRLGAAVNLLSVFHPAEQKAPVKLVISEKNGVRFRGRVTDQKGTPLSGAKITIWHNFRGVGRNSSYGIGRLFGDTRTGPDGFFESAGHWAKDSYTFKVRLDGYGEAESKQITGQPGTVVEVPALVLTRATLAVSGTVVGLDGKPVAGVTVFGVDGPSPFSTTSDTQGRFRLRGFFEAPGFVFAKKDGYRTTALPVTPGGKTVTITLRKLAHAPAPPPRISAEHVAADKELTRLLLSTLWGIRTKYGYARHTIECMARFDFDTAKAWRDEEKQRSAGEVDFTPVLDRVHRERTLFDLARNDVDEALDLIPKGKDSSAFREVLELGNRLAAVDPAKAERVAEDAVLRARQMALPERAWSLAQAGELATRAGRAAGGRQVLAEAADWAEKLVVGGLPGLARGMVAARLAPVDWPRAKKLLDAFKDPSDYNRHLRSAAARIAETDPVHAQQLLTEFRPGNVFSAQEAPLLVAFRIARKHPDAAVALVEKTESAFRVKGLFQLAGHLAATDEKRAVKLVDEAFAVLEKDSEAFRSWTYFGGRCALAALAVHRAKEIGYPDVSALVARTLALRPTEADGRERHLLQCAGLLALTDPGMARDVLAGIAPPEQFVDRAASESRDWLFVLALADPKRAIGLVDRLVGDLEKSDRRTLSRTGLVELGSILTGRDRLEMYSRLASAPREVSDED
jgi:protocatechuate 3,4-dioxygenase beta subunit